MSGRRWQHAAIALIALSQIRGCGNWSNKNILAGGARVVVQLNQATPGTSNSIDASWSGNWVSDISYPEPGLPVGDLQASGNVSVPRAMQTAVLEFPRAGNMRRGNWQVTLTGNADGVLLANGVCRVEIPSDKTMRITFTEGSTACTTEVVP